MNWFLCERDITNMRHSIGADGSDLRLMSWGDESGVPTSGNDLVIVGIDNDGLLHIRIFDAGGNRTTDTDETKLPGAQAGAISTLKRQLPGLSPPHVLTGAEKAQVLSKVTSIVGQTRADTSVSESDGQPATETGPSATPTHHPSAQAVQQYFRTSNLKTKDRLAQWWKQAP
jgi:hypothetical protein